MPRREQVSHSLEADTGRSEVDAERGDPFAILDEIQTRNADRDPDEAERDVAEEITAMRTVRRYSAAPDRG